MTEQNGRTVNYTYDALYRLTQETVSGDATTNGAVSYTYDAVGNRLTRSSTLARRRFGNLDLAGSWKWKRPGSWVETDSPSENHITGKVVYVYKGKDQPKEMLIYNQDGSLRERVVIDYDSSGNWTKRTHRVKAATAAEETTRQIDYRTVTYR